MAKINEGKYEPEVLISNGADSIRNAISNFFGKKDTVMCWAHMGQNVDEKAEAMVNKNHQDEISEDIEILQKSQNKQIFKIALGLFLKKRKTLEPEFSGYEGFGHFTPSTNNVLESFNRMVKDENTLGNTLEGTLRHPFSRFKEVALEMVA